LLGQKRYAEAEPLIVSGYEGMIRPEARLHALARLHPGNAAARVIRLYEAWGKSEKAAAWKARLGPMYLDAMMPNGPNVFAR
jgi:hypothetical protein